MAHTRGPTVPLDGRGMFPQHEHRFPAFTVQLLEQDEWFFFHAEAAFLVAEDDVEGVLAPVGVDVVFLESGGEDFVTGVFHADAELLEDLNRRSLAARVHTGSVVLGLKRVTERLG